MKILVVPDTHGQINGLEVARQKINEVDKIVFMGDYFDNFLLGFKGMKAAENFKELVKFARENKDKVCLCIGNHDYDNYFLGGRCSGYQSGWFLEYNKLLAENVDLLNVVYEFDGWWFSHAGVSKVWLNELENFEFSFISKENWQKLSSVEKINYVFHKQFNEKGFVKRSFVDGIESWFTFNDYDYSCCGEYSKQGPLWIRPHTLLNYSAHDKQVVGHTE